MSDRWRELLPIDLRRKTIRLQEPGTQLRLPIYVLLLTLVFGGIGAMNGYVAFGKIYHATLMTASPAMESLITEQTRNFVVTSACIAAGYLLMTVSVCVAYLHRVIGAVVPLRRHVVALCEGDYTSRARLRKSDASMTELAKDLNDLASQLELNPPKRED